MSKKQYQFRTQGEQPRTRIDRAVKEGRFQHALDQARQLYKNEPTPEHRLLLHNVALGRARQLRQEGHTRDATAVLEAMLTVAGMRLDWQHEIAQELAQCGAVQRAMALLGPTAGAELLERMQTRAADLAVEQQKAGRALLPEALRPDFDRIMTAFQQIEAGQDDAARDTLQGIGLRSPFLEWKLFLRGLQAYYQNDDARAVENWQRLKPDRVPARLAAPLRFTLDRDFQAAQPPATQGMLTRQLTHLQGGEAVRLLRELREALARTQNLASVFRQAERAVSALKREAPHLLPRLATVFYWATLTQGQPEDVPRYQRVFGSPPDDPQFHRLHALAWERAGALEDAHSHWQQLEKEIAKRADAWPGEQGTRARALIWQRMGRNAETIPDGETLKRLPPMLRNHPSRPKPLKPGAEQCFKQGLALAPDQPETYLLLFQHYREQNKFDKAIETGRSLLERSPNHHEMLTELGELLMKEHHYADALEIFQRALKNNPLDRELRQQLSTAHIYNARTFAENAEYDEARREYQAALELKGKDDGAVLCKWAACEIKAGDEARGEELLGRAIAAEGSALGTSYSMLIEAIRLKLKPAIKKRFDQAFKTGVTAPPEGQAAAMLASTTASHEAAGVRYYGQKTHQKKVLDYLKKAMTLDFTEEQLQGVCRSLLLMGAYRLTGDYCRLARRKFKDTPEFPLIQVENEVRRGPGSFNTFTVEQMVKIARELADRLPPGPRRELLLERIGHYQKMLEMTNPFRGIFDDFFDFDPFEDNSEEDYWDDE